jgi:hypothetical protein
MLIVRFHKRNTFLQGHVGFCMCRGKKRIRASDCYLQGSENGRVVTIVSLEVKFGTPRVLYTYACHVYNMRTI